MRAEPILSIVVPFHNVERYLGDCLASISSSSFPDFEVLMVDDGSRDRSAWIAERYCSADPRFKLFSQPNLGTGAARNTALRQARGRYIAFADGDDVVPKDSYSTLLWSLRHASADFATGRVRRIADDGKLSRSKLHEWALASATTNTNALRRGELLADTCLWNKVFAVDFARKHIYPIPERSLYEDVLAVTRGYTTAASVNLVDDVVYHWRKRGDGSSITQGMHRVATMSDRFRMLIEARAHIAKNQPRLLRSFDAKCLAIDVPITLRARHCGNHLYRMTAYRSISVLFRSSELIDEAEQTNAGLSSVVRLLREGNFGAADHALGRKWPRELLRGTIQKAPIRLWESLVGWADPYSRTSKHFPTTR